MQLMDIVDLPVFDRAAAHADMLVEMAEAWLEDFGVCPVDLIAELTEMGIDYSEIEFRFIQKQR